MHIQHITFKTETIKNKDTVSELASNFVATLRMNGQVCGREWPSYFLSTSLVMVVLTPEKNSLSNKFAGKYVSLRKQSLTDAGVNVGVQIASVPSHSTGWHRWKMANFIRSFLGLLTIRTAIHCK
jgi:predicted  nucleic acid-binding Zn ribbon protein